MRATSILLTAAMMVFMASCDSLTGIGGGGNLLENWKFVPKGDDVSPDAAETMSPWTFSMLSRAVSTEKGGDGKKGYVGLVRARYYLGNSQMPVILGGVVRQPLATRIRAGHTYTITISGSLSATLPDVGKVVSLSSSMPVRFAAYNDTLRDLPYTWKESRGSFATIGEVKVTEKQWQNYVTAEWTADADYNGFVLFVGDAGMGEQREKTSSDSICMIDEAVFLDNVILQEKE